MHSWFMTWTRWLARSRSRVFKHVMVFFFHSDYLLQRPLECFTRKTCMDNIVPWRLKMKEFQDWRVSIATVSWKIMLMSELVAQPIDIAEWFRNPANTSRDMKQTSEKMGNFPYQVVLRIFEPSTIILLKMEILNLAVLR